MSNEAKTYYEQSTSRMGGARAAAPDAARGFGALFQAVMKEGELNVREKELIALGIGIALRCDSCAYAHIQKALQAGATRQQVMEVAGVAVMMQGGPAYTYLPKVVDALDALEDAA